MPRSFTANRENGFVLIVSMIMLLVLSLLGIWSLATSKVEIQIAGNQQRFNESFNIAEGGANTEATKVGFADRSEYLLVDQTQAVDLTTGSFATISTWPEAKLILNDSTTAYRYFVKSLGPGSGNIPKEFAIENGGFSRYDFRINGAHSANLVNIELGGFIIGKSL